MHDLSAFGWFIRALFWLMAAALAVRLVAKARRWRHGEADQKVGRATRRNRSLKWQTSGIAALLFVMAFVCLSAKAIVEAYRWHRELGSAVHQKTLTLDLYIPHVSPDRIYTVVAKFGVGGRRYTSIPLHIRFGKQKPVYHLQLYYDAERPERNGWTQFSIRGSKRLDRAYELGTACIILALLLLEWGNSWRMGRDFLSNTKVRK